MFQAKTILNIIRGDIEQFLNFIYNYVLADKVEIDIWRDSEPKIDILFRFITTTEDKFGTVSVNRLTGLHQNLYELIIQDWKPPQNIQNLEVYSTFTFDQNAQPPSPTTQQRPQWMPDTHLWSSVNQNCDALEITCSSYTIVSDQRCELIIVFRGTKNQQLILEGWQSLQPCVDGCKLCHPIPGLRFLGCTIPGLHVN
uniref:Galectin n=1 Tax=Meloidogyne floridensis TaxID=298350 RepID=A0A915NFI0_9BILA